MATFNVPDAGTVWIQRAGEDPQDPGCRVLWRVKIRNDQGERIWFSKDVSTPQSWGVARAAESAIGFMLDDLENEDGDVPEYLHAWLVWDFDSSDNESGTVDSIAHFAKGIVHWRMEPFTLADKSYQMNHGSVGIFRSLEQVRDYVKDHQEDGSVWDVYPNDADEPAVRFSLGARGGIRQEKF